jgi:thiamine phosphate phosphatase / amino-HMP aminohydrolase
MHPVILRYRIIIFLYMSALKFTVVLTYASMQLVHVLNHVPLLCSLPQNNALQIEELLDKLSVSLTGEELEIIGKLYQQAMKLEVEFFSAKLVDQPVVAPLSRYCDPKYKLLIFSDFDLTCTVVDSSAILAEIAILSFQKASQSGIDNNLDRAKSGELRNLWNMLSKQYMEEYEECMERLLPPEECMCIVSSVFHLFLLVCDFAIVDMLERFNYCFCAFCFITAKSLDYDKLYKGLEVLAEFEKAANSRVVDSGVLRGMNLEDIRKAGERLILQGGCKNFFQKIVKTREILNLDIHILSYCWCAELIRSAFSSGILCLPDDNGTTTIDLICEPVLLLQANNQHLSFFIRCLRSDSISFLNRQFLTGSYFPLHCCAFMQPAV